MSLDTHHTILGGEAYSPKHLPSKPVQREIARFSEKFIEILDPSNPIFLPEQTEKTVQGSEKREGEKQTLQELRDEVREMVKAGRPLYGIQTYRGERLDGDAVEFFRKFYGRYIQEVGGEDVIFAHDLQVIDHRLRASLYNKKRTIGEFVVRPKSCLIDAMLDGKFTDGLTTKARIRTANHNRQSRKYKMNK